MRSISAGSAGLLGDLVDRMAAAALREEVLEEAVGEPPLLRRVADLLELVPRSRSRATIRAWAILGRLPRGP